MKMNLKLGIDFPAGENIYRLSPLRNGSTSWGCQSLKAKAYISGKRCEKPARTKEYSTIFWIKEDFHLYAMVQLFSDISKN